MKDLLKTVATIDFETLPIDTRPSYPPAPVGVALKLGDKPSRYYAWGHPAGNNCSWGEARQALLKVYESGRPLLFHNANFDVDVAETHMAMPRLPWRRYFDTLPGLFLLDPRAQTFSLKPSAERYLKLKPEERDAVIYWLVSRQPIRGVRISDKPKSDSYAGAYIAYAPPSIVGPYACGDVDRTFSLAEIVFEQLAQRCMMEPYDRERQLLLPLLTMEREGVRVDALRLRRDIELYRTALLRLDTWLRKKLRAPGINLDSGRDLAAALLKANLATREGLGVTPTGQVQTSKDALEAGVTDKQVLSSLCYRGALGTCLRTFMEPWCETAEHSGGLIYTRWHSTRTDHREGGAGTRTGRLSSTPNFQNIPTEFKTFFYDAQLIDELAAKVREEKEETERKALIKTIAHVKHLPRAPVELLRLPQVRVYVIPDSPDHVLADRDYNQQELRVAAHYEDGALKDAYREKPDLDVHDMMRNRINTLLNASYDRKPIKTVNFAVLYGTGLGHLAEMLETSIDVAKKLKNAYFKILPGLKAMYDDMRDRAKKHKPIRTWGGREYYCEDPVFIDGRMRTFDYKMVNLLVQGSSADITKQAIINYFALKPSSHKLRMTVHDELLVSMPGGERERKRGMSILQHAMETVELDVKLLTDGNFGRTFQQAKGKSEFKDVRETGGPGLGLPKKIGARDAH